MIPKKLSHIQSRKLRRVVKVIITPPGKTSKCRSIKPAAEEELYASFASIKPHPKIFIAFCRMGAFQIK
ncbi:MAG: hypothetical protein HY360_07355 [Verrucomicrobia bacterium]|nr:hypothetical protein [Verrucomicrobiota bacterium]